MSQPRSRCHQEERWKAHLRAKVSIVLHNYKKSYNAEWNSNGTKRKPNAIANVTACHSKCHGVPFKVAVAVFDDPHRVLIEDSRRDYGERRLITFGEIDGRLYAVVHTARGNVMRIISARKANRKEERKYGHRSLYT